MTRKTSNPHNRLRELRERDGLKRHELAVEIGVDPTTVYRWEMGASIDDETKSKLAAVFGVTRPFLMGWDEEQAPEVASA